MCRMLATCMNALSLQAALESAGVVTRVQTAIEMRVGFQTGISLSCCQLYLPVGHVCLVKGNSGMLAVKCIRSLPSHVRHSIATLLM